MSISAIDGRGVIDLVGPQTISGRYYGNFVDGTVFSVTSRQENSWATEFLAPRTDSSWRYALYHESGGWTPFTVTTPGAPFGANADSGLVTYKTTLLANGILTLEAITSPPAEVFPDGSYTKVVYRTMKETYDLEKLTYTFEYDYKGTDRHLWAVNFL